MHLEIVRSFWTFLQFDIWYLKKKEEEGIIKELKEFQIAHIKLL